MTKKFVPRRPRRKAKAKKASKSPASSNSDVHRFSVKMVTALTPVQGGIVSNYINAFFSTTPGQGTASNSAPLLYSTEFALYRQMFDQFRILGMTVKVIPKATMTDATALVNGLNGLPGLTLGRNVYYTVIDRDGTVPSQLSAIKKYASHKVHKMTSSATRSYSVKYDGPNQWLDCQDVNGLQDVQKSLGIWGGISVYGESFMEPSGTILNQPWCDVEVTYRFSFRGKSLLGVAVGQDGSVTLSQPDPQQLDPVTVYPSNDEVAHYGAIDLSGNVIGLPQPEPPAV